MDQNNPYEAPLANIENRPTIPITAGLEKTAKGQKLVVYAVLIYFIAAFSRIYIGPFAFLLLFASLIMSLIGLYMVLAERQSHIAVKILLFILLFIPLVNIFVLLRINAQATKTLREAGYKVGLMGAKRPRQDA